MLENKDDLDEWYKHMVEAKIKIFKNIQDHRDNSRSFYCYDPDKNILQFLWHPTLNK